MRMQIFVTTPIGMKIPIQIKKSATVEALKDEIWCRNRVLEMHLQRLIYDGKELEDDKTLGEYGIGRNSTVAMEFTEDGIEERTWGIRGWCMRHYFVKNQHKVTHPKPNGTLPVKSTNTGKKRSIVQGKFQS